MTDWKLKYLKIYVIIWLIRFLLRDILDVKAVQTTTMTRLADSKIPAMRQTESEDISTNKLWWRKVNLKPLLCWQHSLLHQREAQSHSERSEAHFDDLKWKNNFQFQVNIQDLSTDGIRIISSGIVHQRTWYYATINNHYKKCAKLSHSWYACQTRETRPACDRLRSFMGHDSVLECSQRAAPYVSVLINFEFRVHVK
jgi:hypothetical protein